MFKAVYKSIYDAGIAFAEGPLKRMMDKPAPGETPDETKTSTAGIVALGTGGTVKSIGYVFLGLTAVVALTNPVTVSALVGYAATVALFGGAVAFGKGMEKGGDNLTGLVTFSKNFRKGIVDGVKEDFKAWRGKKVSGPFASASADAPATTTEAAAPATQAPAKAQPAPMENK